LAFAGDSVENSNVNEADANSYILKLSQLENVFEEISSQFDSFRSENLKETEYFDTVFENEIKNIVTICEKAYE
jgi:archaellum component FlaC